MFKSRIAMGMVWALALFLIGWTMMHLPLSSIKESVLSLTLPQWFAWIGINTMVIGLGTKRWHILINMLKEKINFTDLFFIRQAGYSINFVTPGPQFGGEPLQVYWMYRSGITLEKALISIGLDRCFELLINFAVLLMCLVFLLVIGDVPFFKTSISGIPMPGASSTILFVVFAAIGCGVVLISLQKLTCRPVWITRYCHRLLAVWAEHRFTKKIKESWRVISAEFRVVVRTQKSTLMKAVFISFLGWSALIGELVLLLQFLNVNFDVTAFLLILVAMRLALLLPIPGGVGTLEASIFWSFHYLQLPDVAAVGLIAFMRLRDIIILLLGFYCLRKVNKFPSAHTIPSC